MGKEQIYSGTLRERKTLAGRKYAQSDKGKAAYKKYQQSQRGKTARQKATEKYRQSEKYKQYQRKYAEYGGYEHHLKCKYGMTFKQYNQMLKQQNDVCAICGKVNLDGRRLFVDHNHKTGKIRGLLCKECNTKLGVLENEKFIKHARKYLGERN